MKKRIIAFLMMFLMCFTTVVSYHAFDNGQIIADARDLGIDDEEDNPSQGGSNTNTTTMIDAPAMLLFLAENGNAAVVDHVAKKIYFTITIQAIDAFSSTPHCNSGKLTFQYDSTKFSVSDVSGTFMGANNTNYDMDDTMNGVITVSVTTMSTPSYSLASILNVVLSFDDLDVSTLANLTSEFKVSFTSVSSHYTSGSYTYARTFKANLCNHAVEYQKSVDVPANCHEYSHTDVVCSRCGETLSSKQTGFTYGDHVYDYGDFVRTPIQSYTKCTASSTYNTVTSEIKCQECGENHWVTDLEYHSGIKASSKYYDTFTKKYYYHCTSCNQDVLCKIQDTDNAICTHEYEVVSTIPSNCKVNGSSTSRCKLCYHEKVESLPLGDHSYAEQVVTAPTCTASGTSVFTCTICAATKTEATAIIPHNYGENTVIVAPTCVAEGQGLRTCVSCNASETVVLPIDTSAHRYPSTWTVENPGTCVEKKVESVVCELCGNKNVRSEAFGEHSYTKEILSEKTCYESGVYTYTCEHCGDSYEDVYPCTGHTFGATVSDGKGTETTTCEICKMSIAKTVKGDKITKVISVGPFALTIKDSQIASGNVELKIVPIAEGSDEYGRNATTLSLLSQSYGKTYSIQDIYHVNLIVNGVETKFTSDMTLTYALDSALEDSKTEVVYFSTSDTGSNVIKRMDEASRKKLNITLPGKALATASGDTIMVVVEGARVSENGDTPVTPPTTTPGGNGDIVVPIIIIAVALVATVAVIVVVMKKNKNSVF